ncbi:MAG TPA: hypothetical protein VJA94_13610 [Candidatus Angelobacter sp.]
MKKSLSFAVMVVCAICVPISGAGAQSSPALTSDPAGLTGTALVVQLAQTIDAKKARAGDKVKAEFTQDVLAHGEVIVRRGSKIEGHVTEAKPYSKEHPESVLGIIFDTVFLKGGGELSVNALVVALAPAVEEPDVLASSTYGGSTPNGAQRVSSTNRPLVDPRDRIDHTRDDALRNASNPDSYGTQNTLQGGHLGSGNRGVFGMPALSLKVVPESSGPVIVSSKSSIKLEKGTQMVLEITAGSPR